MKTLQKILTCVLAVCFALTAFAGCSLLPGRQDDAEAGAESANTPTEGKVGSIHVPRDLLAGLEASTEPEDTLAGGKLIAATNASFPPFEYNQGGRIVGIDIDIVNEIARRLDMEPEIQDVTFESIVPGVHAGKYDMGIAGMTATPEREQFVSFSRPYCTNTLVIIVLQGSPYESFRDFYTGMTTNDKGDEVPTGVQVGVRIGVENGTTADIYCSDTPENYGFGEQNVARYDSAEDALQALIAGRLTAVVMDGEAADRLVRSEPGLTIQLEPYTQEDYVICVAKDNERLLQTIDKVLANMESDGTLDQILNRYIH